MNRISGIEDEDLRKFYQHKLHDGDDNDDDDDDDDDEKDRDSNASSVSMSNIWDDYEIHDEQNMFKGLEYTQLERIGEGTFGVVMKAGHKATGAIVALKKIRIRQSELEFFNRTEWDDISPFGGDCSSDVDPRMRSKFERSTFTKHNIQQQQEHFDFPLSAMQELTSLQHLRMCPNVIDIYDNFAQGSSLVLVLECMDTDLSQVLQNFKERGHVVNTSVVKSMMIMILRAVDQCHRNSIIHRDIKPANFLVDYQTGNIKLGDFGLATAYREGQELSHQVATRWYRAPELLYGCRHYDTKIDMWSVGCIFAELLNGGYPLFPGESDIDQLGRVIEALGEPTPEKWPGVEDLPDYNKIMFNGSGEGVPLETLVLDAPMIAIDLLRHLLRYDHNKRFNAREAITHEYFRTEPLPYSRRELAQFMRGAECNDDMNQPMSGKRNNERISHTRALESSSRNPIQ